MKSTDSCSNWNIEALLKNTVTYQDEIEKVKKSQMPVVLFGAGSTSEYIVRTLKQYGLTICAFCDNDKNKIGTITEGYPVIDITEIQNRYQDSYIYITTQMYYREIRNQLITCGVQSERIAEYDWVCQFEWENNYIEFVKKYKNELHAVFCSLGDEKSKLVLWNRLHFLITRKREYVVNVRDYEQKQYFPCDMIDLKKIKSFMDIGTYTGDSILAFRDYAEFDQCQVWGFEPDENIYETARKNLNQFPNVKIEKAAFSDRSGYARVSSQMGIMQTIEGNVFANVQNPGDVMFKTCTLDEFFSDKKVKNPSMIKMDVEGAEMAVLRGGKNFISQYRPVIAVCIYHKAEDIIEIPEFLHNLCNEYTFYMRHYSDNQTETVLYALSEEVNNHEAGESNK